MQIEKKMWPDYFKKIENGEKRVDVRLADFDVNIGDTIIFREYDPATKQYTGKQVSKEIIKLDKLDLKKFWAMQDIEKNGIYLIGLKK